VSAATLAIYLARSENTCPDGFVVETRVAGGHSAAPRGKLRLTEAGEPAYGPRDEIDLAKIAAVGLPFWLAGGYAGPERLAVARERGAIGVQVGTAFALCRESGLPEKLRERLVREALAGTLVIRNRAEASPTGFPFKLVDVPGSVSDERVFANRPRLCDLGYLRSPYRRVDGTVGYRCPAEPVEAFVRKGGAAEDATGRRCLCNGLVATIDLGQHRAGGYDEPPLVTLGQDLSFLPHLPPGFSAADVVAYLLS
jgi:NAD(P)H-dependent flavin oxidoreductase YrpB (nitropropane dioxygenase family)